MYVAMHCTVQLELYYDVEGCENGCVLMSARVDADSNVHCVLMTLTILSTEDVPRSVAPTNKPKPATVNTVLHWLTFTQGELSAKPIYLTIISLQTCSQHA